MELRGLNLNNNSQDKYIEKVVDRYSKLFGLPTKIRLLLYIGILSIHGGILLMYPFNLSFENFFIGLGFGVLLFLITIISDILLSYTLMKDDLIFNLRRCLALSFFSSLIWFGILLLSFLIKIFFGISLDWTRFILLGFNGLLILRLLVLSIISFVRIEKIFFSSFLQPIIVLSMIFYVGSIFGYFSEELFVLLGLISIFVAIVIVFIFKFFMDRVGTGNLGIPSSALFKAFLANWTEDHVEPLENFFEKLGSVKEVKVSLLIFRVFNKIKAAVIVPYLHPGPFKNLGSSYLPSMIQTAIRDKFGCAVSVPHGLVGHELDIASQSENKKVVEHIVDFIKPSVSYSKSTPMIRTISEDSTATCQIFGDCALITLTTAPKTMEDLPAELNSFILNEAKKRGLFSLTIDAHNSMNGKFDLEAALDSFSKTSVDSINKALKNKKGTLKIGASTIFPLNFSIEEGMGAGGITVIISEVDGKKDAYITIDGNNMVSGLREKILSSIKELGIDNGEVLTTDTHSVCGLIRGSRGYNLLGEVIDHSKLIDYIKKGIINALNNLEPVTVSFNTKSISEVKVIGEEQINELTTLADKTTETVKRVALILFPVASILLTLIFLFLF